MGYTKILALDLDKFKSVGCAMDVASKEHAFATLETSREALKAWVVAQARRGRRKLAIAALARKILIVLWGMLKTNTPFKHATAETAAAAAEAAMADTATEVALE